MEDFESILLRVFIVGFMWILLYFTTKRSDDKKTIERQAKTIRQLTHKPNAQDLRDEKEEMDRIYFQYIVDELCELADSEDEPWLPGELLNQAHLIFYKKFGYEYTGVPPEIPYQYR